MMAMTRYEMTRQATKQLSSSSQSQPVARFFLLRLRPGAFVICIIYGKHGPENTNTNSERKKLNGRPTPDRPTAPDPDLAMG
jgi:hypothetical protein